MKCTRCNGTGNEPERVTLECVSCNRKVTVTMPDNHADIVKLCESVRCAECKKLYKT